MRAVWNFRVPGHLVFGCGAANRIGELVSRQSIRRAVLVTDRNLVAAGLAATLLASLSEAGVHVDLFDGGEAEPSLETAARAAEHARQCRPDAILALGGGSNMDLAKVIAVLVTHGGVASDYFGFDRVPGPVLPLICVPTTAGTGSEVSHAAVLTDPSNQIKVSTLSHHIRPALAVVDPDLTLGCPQTVRADAGMDALTHAIEAYTAVDYDQLDVPVDHPFPYEGRHPLGDCVAEKAIELVQRHLVAAVHDPENREAREGMALAATLAGMAFSNCGVALVHALEYPLGGALHCSHGAGNALLLPHVMRFNLPARKSVLARIAVLLGQDVAGLTAEQAAERAVDAVVALSRSVGIPQRIRDLGGRPEQLPQFAEKTFAIKRLLTVNPRRATYDDLLGLLQAAY